MDIEPRLLARGSRNPETGCLEWQGATDINGYGVITITTLEYKRVKKVHRVAYEIWIGPLIDGMVICHACDNPPCFNPEHLWQGTTGDNVRDAFAKSRRKVPPEFLAANPNRDKTCCIRGHPFDAKNTHYTKSGARKCRKCHALKEARRRDAKRLEDSS